MIASMNESILTWNVANWVTVIMMVAVLYFVAALASRLTQGRGMSGKKTPAPATTA